MPPACLNSSRDATVLTDQGDGTGVAYTAVTDKPPQPLDYLDKK